MGFFARWRIHKRVAGAGPVEVSEKDGVRRMHFGTETVQSAMRVDDPFRLEIAYTRSMMACLLFHPQPRDFLMIGLGGGSTAKWVHRSLPESRTTVVECNPEVIRVAHAYFHVPPDDERLRVLVGDGAQYLAERRARFDVVMVDGYDETAQSPALGTPEFYADCRAALGAHGVLAINLWGSDPKFHDLVKTLGEQFEGLVLCLPAEQRGNVIAFGLERSLNSPKWDDLRAKARLLETRFGLEFLSFAEGLRKLNLHNDRRLLI